METIVKRRDFHKKSRTIIFQIPFNDQLARPINMHVSGDGRQPKTQK